MIAVDIPLFGDIFSNFGRLTIGLFAVAGGFVVGHLLTGVLVWASYKRLSKSGKCPLFMMKTYRLVGATLTALIIAAIFFGEGGFGLWGGPSEGAHGDATKGKLDHEKKKDEPEKEKKDEPSPPEKKKGDVPSQSRIRITMLGDEAKEGRFYLVEDESQPKSLEEVKAAIEQRNKAGSLQLVEMTVYTYSNTADRNNPIVKRLVEWAQKEMGLQISYPATKGKRPGT